MCMEIIDGKSKILYAGKFILGRKGAKSGKIGYEERTVVIWANGAVEALRECKKIALKYKREIKGKAVFYCYVHVFYDELVSHGSLIMSEFRPTKIGWKAYLRQYCNWQND